MSVFLFLLLIVAVILCVLDLVNIVKWHRDKKKKLQQLKQDPALDQLLNALNDNSKEVKK